MENDKPEMPEGLNQETVDACIQHLTEKSNRLNKTMSWELSIQELAEDQNLNGIQASYVFVRWVEYIDNRRLLAKSINFTE